MLKHLSVHTLWVQGAVADSKIRMVKLPRALNHADALCSFHGAPEFHHKMHSVGLRLSTLPKYRRRGGEPNDLHYVSNYVTRRQARAYRLMMAIQVLDGDEAEHAQDEQRNW